MVILNLFLMPSELSIEDGGVEGVAFCRLHPRQPSVDTQVRPPVDI